MSIDPMQILILVIVVLTFLVAAMAVGTLLFTQKQNSFTSRVQKLTTVPEELEQELKTAEKKGLLGDLDLKPVVGKITSEGYMDRVEQDLARADIPLRVSEFLIGRLVFAFLGTIGFIVYLGNPLIGILCGLPLFFIHLPIISLRKSMRISKFTDQMADFLILIVNSLRAGQTFMQGCSVAVVESPHPIAAEFKQVIKEVNLGMPEPESLENMLKRVPTEDLQIVVSAYLIQRKVGGNLAEILETTAGTIRERIKIRGQINTLTTQGKLSGGIVAALPFVLGFGIWAVNPLYIEPLYTTVPGYILIAVAVSSQALGAFIIWQIVNIEI